MDNDIKNEIISFMTSLFPDATCELEYSSDYGFLISVMLSAQTTDKAVNKITSILFNDYPSLDALANASPSDIEPYLRPLGLANNKSKNVVGISKALKKNFNG